MILDTSVLIDIDRGVEQRKVEKLDSEKPHKISAVTRTEFYTGVNMESDTDREKARQLLNTPQEVPMEGEIAEKAGELLARKQKQNLSIGLNDIYIAATALKKDEKVLTKDVEDFNQIKELEVKDWNSF